MTAKQIVLCGVLSLTSGAAFAACIGTGAISTCTDSSGNTYTISRIGNTTTVQGSNAGTGSTWNSTSSRFGSTVVQSGTAADGGSWNQTIIGTGAGTSYFGTDSNGASFSGYCSSLGCQ